MSEKVNSSEHEVLTLGLDMGPSSIGWALIDEAGESIIATGVRVFPEGVDRDPQGGEKSKNQTRREKRMLRRQVQRRARRLRILRQSLVEAELLPTSEEGQEWVLHSDPYPLRARALKDRLEPHEIGRIIYQLAQRRGFLSNRKVDRASDKETKGMLGEIAELDKAIQEADGSTLGEYLAAIKASGGKVRKRHTRRSMYLAEFDAIWEFQSRFYPELLTDSCKYGSQGSKTYPADPDIHRKRSTETHLQRYGLHGIIFFQRRIYWPASLVGKCELEPTEKRCHRADRVAQRFRLLQEVNNLRYRDSFSGEEQKLSDTQRDDLLDYLSTGKERTFDRIRTRLAKKGLPDSARFNFERGGRDKLKGHQTDAAMASRNCLGKGWHGYEEEKKNKIIKLLTTPQLSDDETHSKLQTECGLSSDEADQALNAKLPEGHGKLSQLAIRKLIPYLEQGFFLLGNDATDSALHAAGYLGAAQLGAEKALGPVPRGITNPIVRQALFETRKAMNAILRKYGMPGKIRIELAREAKKSFAERLGIQREIRDRTKEREAAAERWQEIAGTQPKRNDIRKYQLWEEANHICVYCGEAISAAQLTSGEANVDHILPRWRSLDDSYMNKVLVHRKCNEDKGDRTPREWLEDSEPNRYQEVRARAEQLPYPKLSRFTRQDLELEEFVNRHLTDTAYISRQVKDYMQTLGIRVDCSRGSITAELRRYWGLNTILFPEGEGKKTRADHRHHAVDATVVALATPSRLHQLAHAHGKDVEPPWPSLRENLAESVQDILVSHKPRRRLSGALHKDTFFGQTQKLSEDERKPVNERPWARDWQEEESLFVRRKPVSEIKKPKHLASVRDRAIRDYLVEHLRNHGVDPEATSYPKGIFEGDNTPVMPSGVPIRKVRLVERLKTARPAGSKREFQSVQPGNNHHICYYESAHKGKPRWKAKVTTMWDAALRVRRDDLPAIDTANGELGCFLMSLSIGESFIVRKGDGVEQLCIVRKINHTGLIHYRLHTDARKAGELDKENLCFSPESLRKLQAQKVTIDPIGSLRSSGD